MTITRNCEPDGYAGKSIRLATRSVFDAMLGDWHMEDETNEVENYIYDDRNSTEFEVYPPNDGSGCVEAVYSALPPVLAEDDPLTLGDEYFAVVKNYVLYKAALLDCDFNWARVPWLSFTISSFCQNWQGWIRLNLRRVPLLSM